MAYLGPIREESASWAGLNCMCLLACLIELRGYLCYFLTVVPSALYGPYKDLTVA